MANLKYAGKLNILLIHNLLSNLNNRISYSNLYYRFLICRPILSGLTRISFDPYGMSTFDD